MILFNQHLTNILRNQPELEALLGSGDKVRIFAVKTPDQDVYPKLCFQTITNMPWTSLNGTQGLSRRRVQVTAYANDANTAEKIAQIVQDFFLTYRGEVIQDIQPAGFQHEDCDEDRIYSHQVDYFMTVASEPGVKQ